MTLPRSVGTSVCRQSGCEVRPFIWLYGSLRPLQGHDGEHQSDNNNSRAPAQARACPACKGISAPSKMEG